MGRVGLTAAALAAFLAIEFVDELVDGVGSAAWPLVRTDLDLTYVQIGLLLSVPGLVAGFVEPVIGIMGDAGYRRLLVLGGGVVFALALGLISASQGFLFLLVVWIIWFPASGAFVSLSQASLMDAEPARREQNMARWTFAGAVSNMLGPLALTAAVRVGLGWRGAFLAMGALTLPVVVAARRLPIAPDEREPGGSAPSFVEGTRAAIAALRRFAVVKWLSLLQASDLMLDIFKSFLALYMVDVAGASEAGAAIALSVWVGAGLVGSLLLIPLLERVRGLTYLRFSVVAILLLYPAFLLAPPVEVKMAVAGMLGFANAGWYPVLQGRAYSSMPGRSGTIVALGNVFGLASSLAPLGLGVVAARWGLDTAMWLLLAGPALLLAGIARPAADDVESAGGGRQALT